MARFEVMGSMHAGGGFCGVFVLVTDSEFYLVFWCGENSRHQQTRFVAEILSNYLFQPMSMTTGYRPGR